MIDQPTIDRILDAAQIVDVVSDFVTLRKRGVNYVGLCPFHNEKTPSFTVYPENRPKDYVNASPVEKVEMLSISLWNTNR